MTLNWSLPVLVPPKWGHRRGDLDIILPFSIFCIKWPLSRLEPMQLAAWTLPLHQKMAPLRDTQSDSQLIGNVLYKCVIIC